MLLLATYQQREVWFHEAVERPFAFVSPFVGENYRAVVFVHDEAVTKEERAEVTLALVDSQCRLGAFAGENCEEWEWAMDDAGVRGEAKEPASAEAFVLTTSHPGESVEQVMEYALAPFSIQSNGRILVLLIGAASGMREKVGASVLRAWPEAKLMANA